MKVVITFTDDNDAFVGNASEYSHVLDQVGYLIVGAYPNHNGLDGMKLYDSNGNAVGLIEIQYE